MMTGQQTPTAAVIENFELELLQPDVRKSVDRLDALLADDFIEIGASGVRYTKQDTLTIVPSSTGELLTMHEFAIRELAPELILATYRVEKTVKGTGGTAWSFRSSIWQKQNGRWKMIFHQGTALL
jgi:hypothetical protein